MIIKPDPEDRKQVHDCVNLLRHEHDYWPTRLPGGTLADCPTCGKWFYKNPNYSTIWEPVRWYHFSMMRKISEAAHGERDA